ncbi:uncharacterized protein LOC121792595 [Salvia splendens]|uniref:uncharacterized protein LOC121792595 n=1 Tax=Salvia splendens TaxID=180675 RepID=UPI001C27F35D|nr:uncharacterized protein LOC121792595 [Salvia splendens]
MHAKTRSMIQLRWFWAQFLLLHLGTITAYSLEDNELWLRHLVGMGIQTGLAFYILLVAFHSSDWLPYMSVLIFIAGGIKYIMTKPNATSAAFDIIEIEFGFLFDAKASVVYNLRGCILRLITFSFTLISWMFFFFFFFFFFFKWEKGKYKRLDLVITLTCCLGWLSCLLGDICC